MPIASSAYVDQLEQITSPTGRLHRPDGPHLLTLDATPTSFGPDIAAMLGASDLPGPSQPAGPEVAPSASGAIPPIAGGERGLVTGRGETSMGAYEAADRFDKSLGLWYSPIQSADAEILPDKELVDGRSRDQIRNDALMQGGSTLRKNSIVGAQYLLNCRPATRKLFGKDDDVWEEEFQTEVEELFELYAESPDNWIDAARTKNFTEIIRLAVGIDLAGGEVLATAEWDRSRGGDFATMIQMIDPDRLSTAPLSRMDRMVRAGVRKDTNGAPVAYQIRTQHPNDYTFQYALPDWKEIPIRKPWGRLQVIHICEQLRPEQTRGISEIVSTLKAGRMGHKLRDLNLQRIAAQAMFAASITSELPPAEVFTALGGGDASAMAANMTQFNNGYLAELAKYAGGAKNLMLDGVKIPHLYPGTKLDLLSPGKDSVSGSEVEMSLNRYIAAALGVSYAQYSKDYSQTNYSSETAASNETWRFMQSRKKIVADRLAWAIFRLWLEEAINNNYISSFSKKKAGLLYTNGRLNLNFDAISRSEFIGASRGQLDQYKETQAAVLRIENGLSTAEDELARLGKDWRKVYRQLKREMALREQLGIVLVGGSKSAIAIASNDQPAGDTNNNQKAAA
jgi:lambda family phage portal protein